MTEILIAVLSGFLIGLAISLLVFPFLSEKQIKKERFDANVELYHEILLKKQSRAYRYSPAIRKIINLVHVKLLVQHDKHSQHNRTEYMANSRYEPSL